MLKKTIKVTHLINGYEYELQEAAKCIAEGKIEPPSMPWSETLRVLRITDAMRKVWDIKLGDELKN